MEENGLRFYYQPQTIFCADGLWLYGREPILRQMPDGSLICWIYSGGQREPDNHNVVLIARSQDRGETWTSPELLFSHEQRGVWGTEIFTVGKEPFGFVHTLNAASTYLELRTAMSFTRDNGITWTEPIALHGIPANLCVRQGIVLSDGTWLFPVYWQECNGGWDWANPASARSWPFRCGCIRSEDSGTTFSLHGYVSGGVVSLWEPNIVETADGILMLIRAEGTGVLYGCRSRDGGLTWSEARPSDIPDPGTKLTLLKHGERVLLLHNPTECKVGRKCIELWVSDDGGKTWPTQRRLVEVVGDNTGEYTGGRMICYPHAFLADDEELLYVAVDTKTHHYLLKIPYDDFS